MRQEVIVEAVGPGIAQRFEPVGRGRVRGLRLVDGHVEARAQVTEDRALALDLRQPAGRPDVVALDAREVILRLRIQHAEYCVGVGLAVYMRHAEVVADDFHTRGPFLQPHQLRVCGGARPAGVLRTGKSGQQTEKRECARCCVGDVHESVRPVTSFAATVRASRRTASRTRCQRRYCARALLSGNHAASSCKSAIL